MRDELSEARRAAAELRRLQEAAAGLPELEAQAAADARRARAEDELSAAEDAALRVLERARPALRRWGEEYRAWVEAGLQLVQELNAVERELVPALTAACDAAVMFAPPSEPGGEEARALRAVNAELRRLGAGADAYELEPLPPVDAKQYPWAALQMELVPRFVRRIFHPALGARNILQPRVMPTVG